MSETCLRYRADFSAYLDDELEKNIRTEVQAHLEACGECSKEYDTLKSLNQFLSNGLGSETLAVPDLWERMKDSLPSVCEVMTEDLSAYLDGELPVPAQEGVNKHLKECESCLKQFKDLNATNRLISKGLELPVDIKIDIWPAVKARLNEDCALIHTELSPYVDQEVATLRHRAITAHLVDCQGCRTEFNSMSAVGEVIRESYKPAIPADFDLWPAIKRELQVVPFTPKQKETTITPQTKPPRKVLMAAVAAAVVGLVGLTAVIMGSPNGGSAPTISAEAYLIENALAEPSGNVEVVMYEH